MKPVFSIVTLAIAIAAATAFAATPELAAQVRVSTTPYAGLMFTERESQLPGSPIVGGHAHVELSPIERYRDGIRTFIGADIAVAAVDEKVDDGNSELHLDLYVTARAGLALASSPGHPRLFGLVGAAFPGADSVWNTELGSTREGGRGWSSAADSTSRRPVSCSKGV